MGQREVSGLRLKVFLWWDGREPYGDRGACWGCGMEPEVAFSGFYGGYQLCGYCAELKQVHWDNQR